MSRRTESMYVRHCRARGASLVELIMFIVVIGAGLVGILAVMNLNTAASADPLVQKQALAIGEAYLEEVLSAPFTYCDPDDANAATAESTAAVNPANPLVCAATREALGAEGSETRSGSPNFDNVSDYSALTAAAPATLEGTAISGLSAYTVSVAIVAAAIGPGGAVVAANDANGFPQSLRVTVTVTGPGNTTVSIDGYRTRYAPNALP